MENKAQILVKGKRLISSKEKSEHRAHSSYGAQKKPLIVVGRAWAPCGVLSKGLCVDSRTKWPLWVKPTSNQELPEWLEEVSYRVHPVLSSEQCFAFIYASLFSSLSCVSPLTSVLTTVWFFPAMAPYLSGKHWKSKCPSSMLWICSPLTWNKSKRFSRLFNGWIKVSPCPWNCYHGRWNEPVCSVA